MEYYFERYGDLELQRRMVSDQPRTSAFAAAIRETVRSSDVVLDVGTGTGILAMIAAQAGAKQVYAIDQAEIAKTAANLVKANHLAERVRIFRGPAADLELPKKATLIISEWLGNAAFVEGMLDDLVVVRDKHLTKKGRMLPSEVDVILAPLDDSYLYHREGPGYWRRDVEGLDFSSLEAVELGQGRATQIRIEPSSVLAEGQAISSVDLEACGPDDPWATGERSFRIQRDGVLNGFGIWFRARLSKSVVLDTGPGKTETHWSQTYLPFKARMVRKDQELRVRFDFARDTNERRHICVELSVGRDQQLFLIE